MISRIRRGNLECYLPDMKPYRLKHTDAVGWFVDGAYGFLVVGYLADRKTCIETAKALIREVIASKRFPVWRFK